MKAGDSFELASLSGPDALEALLHVIEKTATVKIEGHTLDHIGAIEHRKEPRDIVVSARSVGRQMILSFGSEDEPVIDYRMVLLGK